MDICDGVPGGVELFAILRKGPLLLLELIALVSFLLASEVVDVQG